MFKIGQEVVCVNADDTLHSPFRGTSCGGELVKDKVYRIAWTGMFTWHGETAYCVCVEGVRGLPPDDIPFYARRFRPLRQTDISVFTEILKKVTENA